MRLGDADYVFLINLHHIVADGWSIGVLTEEFRRDLRGVRPGPAVPAAAAGESSTRTSPPGSGGRIEGGHLDAQLAVLDEEAGRPAAARAADRLPPPRGPGVRGGDALPHHPRPR